MRCLLYTMYEEEHEAIKLGASVSYLCSNLDVIPLEDEYSGERSHAFAVVHRRGVEILHVSKEHTHRKLTATSGKADDHTFVTQARWCQLDQKKILVVTSSKGFQLFNQTGSTVLLTFDLSSSADSTQDEQFCRGIANYKNTIYIGTSDGKVLILEQLVTTGELQRSTGSTAVCAIQCTQDGQVAVADEGGLITVWKPNHMDKTMFGKKGVPCTSVEIYGDLLLAGYSCGHIRVYSVSRPALLVDIAAHGQCVTALDVHRPSGTMLSVSEDSTLAVWQLPLEQDTQMQVTHLYSYQVANRQLCGGRFIGGSHRLAVAAYDWNDLVVLRKQEEVGTGQQ